MNNLRSSIFRIVNTVGRSERRSRFFSSLKSSYEHVLTSTHPNEKPGGLDVGLIELNQPKSLNSLSDQLFDDLIHASRAFDDMEDIGTIVITGKGKAFAAGADIPQMSKKEFHQAYKSVSAKCAYNWFNKITLCSPYLCTHIFQSHRTCLHNGLM